MPKATVVPAVPAEMKIRVLPYCNSYDLTVAEAKELYESLGAALRKAGGTVERWSDVDLSAALARFRSFHDGKTSVYPSGFAVVVAIDCIRAVLGEAKE